MLGSLVSVPLPGAQGLIVGDDGADYWFTEAGWRNPFAATGPGMRVEFQARGLRATDVRPEGTIVPVPVPAPAVVNQPTMQPSLAPTAAPVLSPGTGGQPPTLQPVAPPANLGQQQQGPAQGSLLSVMRCMSMIFLLTPVAIPMLLVLPLFGIVELLLTALAPGFLGGMKAGSLGKAMTAAIMVGTGYVAFHYFLVLAFSHFLARLPWAGGYVQSLVEFLGGFGTATAIVTMAITFPSVLALLVSAFAGALAGRVRGRKK